MSDICRNSGANFNHTVSPIHSGARDKKRVSFCSMFTDVVVFSRLKKIKKNSSVFFSESAGIIDGSWFRRE